MIARALLVMTLTALAAPVLGAAPEAERVAFFESKVRPILVERCYGCHSAQAKKLRGSLHLDSKDGWTKGGDSGPAIVPGEPDQSLVVQAVRYTDPDLKMPPKGKLPDAEIATLIEWVKLGAPDPRTGTAVVSTKRVINLDEARKGWAFRPLTTSPIPKVANSAWAQSPVDRFILAQLEAKGLAPNEPATRRALIHRAFFDLIGLPPTPEDVDAFERDDSPDALPRMIDRLLASPHHGERWGRHWLDLARFAESHGFEHDTDRPTAYHYRDFVIEALNRDLPFDTFVKWQLAGDELAPDDNLALKATGFLAAGVHSTQITANQVEKERYDELDDIVATAGTAMLGLTIGCARCHDHKFDPIPQRDYYRLLSTFTTTVRTEVDLAVDRDGFRRAKDAFDKEHAPYIARLRQFETDELPARLARWEAEEWSRLAQGAWWIVLNPTELKSQGGATLTRLDDGSIVATGKNPDFDTYTFVADFPGMAFTGVRIEALSDPSLVKGGPGRAGNGNFDLTDLRLTAVPLNGHGQGGPIALGEPKATFEQPGLPIRAVIDGDPKSGWAIDPQFGKNHAAAFTSRGVLGFQGGARLTFTLSFNGNNGHNFGRFRIAVRIGPGPLGLDGDALPQDVLSALNTAAPSRTESQRATLVHWYRTIDPEWRKRNRAAAEHARKAPIPKVARALIASEGLPPLRLNTQGADFLQQTHFLKRGDPNQKQEVATQAFLQVLTNASDGEKHWHVDPPSGWRTSYRRTAMANWIADADQGAGALLARVIVNRLWQHHFGRGLVATPSDFGAQGEKPSHPDLLDWLASELVRGGWRLKPIHKLIMTSAVYRQSARIDPGKRERDPANALVWHVPRRRLEAEAIRDAMLAVSGKLDSRMYGAGTLDDGQTRRSIYFTQKRSRLIPMLVLFDAPDALQGLAVRASTTIAPQSLLLMNNPVIRDWSKAFAARVSARAGNDPERAVREGFRLALGREPTASERTDAESFLKGAGPDGFDAALADFCQVLLSLNDFMFTD
jgi:hypothetical protein